MVKQALLVIAALGLILGFGATTTRADVTDPSLQDLITGGGSLTVGNLVFSQFGYDPGSGDSPLASNITVGQIPPSGTDVFGNFGIRFGLAGFDTPNTTATDFILTYAVTAPSALLRDIHLVSNLSIAGTPAAGDTPFGNISETIRAQGAGDAVAQINNNVTPASSSLTATATFNPSGPYTTLFVTKDVELFSTPGAITTVSFIDQAFSQVPEPSSLVLLGLGGLGLIGYTWRHRRAGRT